MVLSLARLMNFGNLGDVAHLLQHLQHRLVGAAVQRPPQRGHAAGDAGIGIGAAGAGQAHGRGRGVLLVVGMQDEDAVERARQHRIGLVRLARRGEHHVHEVLRIGQAVLRIDEGLALVVLVAQAATVGTLAIRRWAKISRWRGIEHVRWNPGKTPTSRRSRRSSPPSGAHRGGSRGTSSPSGRAAWCGGGSMLERHLLLRRRQFAVHQQVADFHVVRL